jgi:hypothetical protein
VTQFDERLRHDMRAALAEVPLARPVPAHLMARGERRRTRHRATLLLGALAMAGFLGGGVAVAGPDNVASRAEEFFRESSELSAAKTGGPAIPADHVLVASMAMPQGRTVKLWVTDPGAPSGLPGEACVLIQVVVGTTHESSVGSCGGLADSVELNRVLGAMVGRATLAQEGAVSATVSSPGGTASVRVVNGYFLVPFDVAGTARWSFSVEFFDGSGRRIGAPIHLDA